jgi:hypothetical protein
MELGGNMSKQDEHKAKREAGKAAAILITVTLKGTTYMIADQGLISADLLRQKKPDRDYRPPPESEVDICLAWLKEHATQRKTQNQDIGSYGLKHLVEHDAGDYVSNGAFIVAAWRAGYTLYPYHVHDLNCGFNISLGRGWRKRYYR